MAARSLPPSVPAPPSGSPSNVALPDVATLLAETRPPATAGVRVAGAAHPDAAAAAPTTAGRRRAVIDSETLLAGASEVQIVHRGVSYRLRQTALGKLILTK
jgi:hemin uptake protein HemP